MVGGGPGGAGRIGDGGPGMQPAGCERPRSRAHEHALAAEKAGGARDVEIHAVGRFVHGSLIDRVDGDGRREATAPSGQPFERGPVARRIIGHDLGHVAGPRAVRERQQRHGLRQ
jgi:hypothetical protein